MGKTIKMLVPLRGFSEGERNLNIETDGFKGESCREATRALEQALGTVEKEELTGEYYDTEERHEFLQEGDGEDDGSGLDF